MENDFVWITGGDEDYLAMIEVLAKSLLKHSDYKLIVYGFNCDSNIDLPNVINRRIDFKKSSITRNDILQREDDLKYRDYSIYFAKYLASLDSLKLNYNKFAWIDGDAFATENIDKSLKHLDNLKDYPLFMRYFHQDINNWRIACNVRLEGKYGSELSHIMDIDRNPNNRIIATGFYFYDQNSFDFFNKCLDLSKVLDGLSVKIWVDNNAFSEERVANCVLWNLGLDDYLNITWNNYYSSDNETVVNKYYLKMGWDVMYDEDGDILFIHGPDPSVMKKDANTLNDAYKDYNATKLMIIAHPDDELIFGGAELIKYGPSYKVVLVTTPEEDSRIEEFNKVMTELGVCSWEVKNYEDTLYPTHQTFSDIDLIINSRKWDKIVTHNPVGEYGHPQHKLIFDRVKSLTDDFYVFSKSPQQLPEDILCRKLELLKFYQSEQAIIQHILECKGGWFKSNDSETNYIEHESITKYDIKRDNTPYIHCYDK